MKKCNRCKKSKSLDEFGKNSNFSSGIHTTCKLCLNKRQNETKIARIQSIAEDKSNPIACIQAQIDLLNIQKADISFQEFIDIYTEDVEQIILQLATYTFYKGYSPETDKLKETAWNLINISERDLIKEREYSKQRYNNQKSA